MPPSACRRPVWTGSSCEAYGHLMDQFWSPLTNTLDAPYGGSLDNRLRFTFDVLTAIRKRVGPEFIVGVRYTADEVLEGGLTKQDGLDISRRLKASGMVDFLNVVRGHIDTDAGLTDVIPIQGMASAPHLDFAGEIRAATQFPTFHAARIPDVATARHAIASGKVDMVGMTRAHMPTRTSCARSWRAARTTFDRAWAPTTVSIGSTRAAMPTASTTPPPGASSPCRTRSRRPRSSARS